MKLNNVELSIIKKFLTRNKICVGDDDYYYSNVNVLSRDYSGVGFMTKLRPADAIHAEGILFSPIHSKIVAVLNNNIATGYLVYGKSGFIDAIEGFTYGGEDWPKEIVKIEIQV